MTQLYFAYGSNMSSARLRARIPGAVPAGAARLEGYRLRCNKRGKDGSGKANLVSTAEAEAWGVLFRLPDPDWEALDRFEWGYERQVCHVLSGLGEGVGAVELREAQLYVALRPEEREIPPFDWYRRHCLEGAREHALPGHVVAQISGWRVERSSR